MEHLQQTMRKQEQEQIANAIDFAMPFIGRQWESKYYVAYNELRDIERYLENLLEYHFTALF